MGNCVLLKMPKTTQLRIKNRIWSCKSTASRHRSTTSKRFCFNQACLQGCAECAEAYLVTYQTYTLDIFEKQITNISRWFLLQKKLHRRCLKVSSIVTILNLENVYVNVAFWKLKFFKKIYRFLNLTQLF